LGKVAINSIPVAINQDLKALQCKPQIFVPYLLFAIHHYTWQFVRYGQGSTIKGVRQEDLLNLEIPLPLWIETAQEFGDPVPEPKRRRLMLA
jgi:type I restriction enzyme S subunit